MPNSRYSDTEVYLILFQGGTGGNFLASMLHDFLFSENDIMQISEYGSAHNIFTTNYKIRKTYRQHIDKIYNQVDVIDTSKPIIIYDHLVPDWEELFEKFPKCKVLIITLEEDDYARYRGNFFLKVIAENYKPKINEAPWLAFKQEHSPLLDSIEDPTKIDAGLAEILFNRGKDFFTAPTFMDPETFPEVYRNKVFYVKFYDLMNDNNVLLDQLTAITGRDCPSFAVNTYKKYTEAQRKLAEKYMPWLL